VILQADTKAMAIVLSSTVVLISALYTILGGIKGDASANFVQNIIKAAVLMTVVAFIFIEKTPSANLLSAHNSLPSFDKVITLLTISGLFTNLVFSALWQYADMSTWQNISAIRPLASSHRRALLISAVGAFLFPGVVGTVIGIGLAGVPSLGQVSDNDILAGLIRISSDSPAMVIAILFCFGLAMLSTIDGYALAAGQAVTWDIIYPDRVRNLLANSVPADEVNRSHSLIVTSARLWLLVSGFSGAATVLYLVFGWNVSLFNVVYFAVIAQMTLVPLVLFCLYVGEGGPLPMGWSPATLGLATGFGTAVYGVIESNEVAFNMSSLIGLLTSAAVVGILAYNRPSGRG
jgi:hypothetical protein